MDAAIRWSPRATLADARFLIVDVDTHTVKLCEALGVKYGKIQWNEISRNSKVPPFRAFDWSAAHDICAVGHYAGATVVGLANGSPSLSLPLKLPRNCNAVAFNIERLLASGVERVRNDFCLNIYDVSHWPDAASRPSEARAVEPAHKLAMSEAITSIKFFQSHSSLLVAGVKGTCIRLYDLRERTGNPALQYQTTRVHNIAVDFTDDWYFASAGPAKDSTVQVWDRRSSVRSKGNDASATQDGPLLTLQNTNLERRAVDQPSIWSLRFSPERRGCLGIVNSVGQLKICHLHKDYVRDDPKSIGNEETYVTPITLNRTQVIRHPQQVHAENVGQSASNTDQVVSFDFMNFFSSTRKYQAITLGTQQDVHVHEVYKTAPALAIGHKGFVAMSDWKTRREENGLPLDGLRISDTKYISEILAKQKARRRGSLHYAKAAVRKEAADTWVDWEDQLETTDGRPSAKQEYAIKPTLNRVFEDDMKSRCKEGYVLNSGRNASIVQDDPILNFFWRWMQAAKQNTEEDGMVGGNVDLSYLGVQNIINANLGAEPENRQLSDKGDVKYAIDWLAANLYLTGIEVKEGFLTNNRRLGLHALGLRNDNLKQRVQYFTMSGKNAEGALRALILCDDSLVLGALTNGPRRAEMTFLFDDVHKWLSAKQRPDEERRKMIGIRLSQEEDPFVHAIYAIMLADDRQVLQPFDDPMLPFQYRLAIALRYIEDEILREYIDDETRAAVRRGEMDKIMLTGLSEEGLKLISNYLNITADLQTAVLATSHVVPRYIRRNKAVDTWRAAYRNRLNSWGMYVERCLFDVEASKLAVDHEGRALLSLNPPQVMLRCGNCDGPIVYPKKKFASKLEKSATSGTRSFGGGVLGGVDEVTQCPKCGARLPNCSVCDMPTGVLDPLSRGGLEKEKKDLSNGRDPLDDLMELCMTCDHVYHRGCAEPWFVKHSVCPAVGCDCRCDELDDDGGYAS